MTATEDILETFRYELAEDLLADRDTQYPFQPTAFDIYAASSGLQKSVRRGDTETALKCAARLLESDPARLWRRLAVVAVEDLGVANPDLMSKMVAVAGRSQWRKAHGGQWKVAAHLVDALCRSAKDRSADDLIVLCEFDPDLTDHRRCFETAHVDRLAELAIDKTLSLPTKALAAWYGCGTARYRSGVLRERRGEPNLIFDSYQSAGIDERIVETCRFAARQSNFPMAIFIPILAKAAQRAARHVEPDPTPAKIMIGDLPSYVFDSYTRPGKTAIRRWIEESEPLRQYLEAHAPEKHWPKIVGLLLFRAEGGLLLPRLRWSLGDDIRHKADILIPGLPSKVVPEGLRLLRRDLPMLNEARHHVAEIET